MWPPFLTRRRFRFLIWSSCQKIKVVRWDESIKLHLIQLATLIFLVMSCFTRFHDEKLDFRRRRGPPHLIFIVVLEEQLHASSKLAFLPYSLEFQSETCRLVHFEINKESADWRALQAVLPCSLDFSSSTFRHLYRIYIPHILSCDILDIVIVRKYEATLSLISHIFACMMYPTLYMKIW